MIKRTVVILTFCLLPVLSCHKEDQKEKPKGDLKIEIGLYVSVGEVNENLKSTQGTEDFKVVIYSSSGQEVLAFERASDMPEVIELETGNYYAAAYSDNNLPAAFENPYYYGKSGNFSIIPDNQQTIVINCELANTMVTVVYSDIVKSNYSDFSTKVTSAEGSLTFAKDETRAGYFKPLPLSIQASLTWQKPNGDYETRVLTGNISDPQPKRKYEIHVNAAAGGGSSTLMINLDVTSGPVEIVEIDETNPEPDSILESGDLLITEIMFDPTALPDADGEWFEIYNNTGHSVSLKNLVIEKNETDRHAITEKIILLPGAFQVFSRTENAVSGTAYVYGSGISLNNTGAVLSVSNYGTDGMDGSEICSVNYGAVDFPQATGASICLDPGSMNEQDAVSGLFWCVSGTAYSTGDLGTPGSINDDCD